jgi:acyl-CoA reductase-like NAD-dependent aldehyde dehydrogenase
MQAFTSHDIASKFPLNQITLKIASAPGADCNVVLKPGEIAPINAMILAEVVDDLDDADFEAVVKGTLPASLLNSGQTCSKTVASVLRPAQPSAIACWV